MTAAAVDIDVDDVVLITVITVHPFQLTVVLTAVAVE